MKRLLATTMIVIGLAALASGSASAAFGLSQFDVSFTGADGQAVTQAGSHPFEMTTTLEFVSTPSGEGGVLLDEAVKDILIDQVEGFVGNPTAAPRCSGDDFLTAAKGPGGVTTADCSDAAAVGVVSVTLANKLTAAPLHAAIYNLQPPPGVAAKLGFWITEVPVTIELGVKPTPPYNVTGGPTNISQILEVVASEFTIWGTPADPAHDALRGHCVDLNGESAGICPANVSEKPFLTLPRACEGPLPTVFRIDSWQNPGAWVQGSALTHDVAGPAGFSGCGKLGFGPEASVQSSTAAAESAAGLAIGFEVEDEGMENPEGLAEADIAATEFSFPAGMTLNPSAAEGLGVCSLAQFEAESLARRSCPEASKLGTIEADTPILENHTLRGSIYLAAQDDPSAPGAENPFGSLFAAYIVIRDPELGVFVTLASRIETDPTSGRITAEATDLPPFPLSRVAIELRSGPRAPFITPPACGSHSTEMKLTPSSGAPPLVLHPSFQIGSGPNGAPCPAAGVPPFEPGFEAGAENGAAGAHSPFSMRLTRRDGDQDLTKFSATLPPGVTGKLAGVARCPDAAIAAAEAKSGRAEQASPSCSVGSQVGTVLAGAGVGTALTYVDGKLYLAGPYNGAPLSVAAIVPAVAGPFDVGTVVTRVALKLNPVSAQVEVDGSRSDPIPHILEGIPLKVRDIRVFADRPSFTLNPTSCEPAATTAEIFGSFANPFDPADDAPVSRSARYQAASCASLGFKPKLGFKLKGGTRRGGHPALRATYTPRPGDANLEGLVVRLPRSAFLDQAHIRTICTRVQWAADACPPAARYGYIKATTPLLDEPLQGPVYLRSSDHNLPDLVFDLKGIVDIEVTTRIDSVKGGIRAIVQDAPDAPIAKVELSMQGGRKGLIVNSRDICAKTFRAAASFTAHNGRRLSRKPALRASCKKARKGRGAGKAKRRGR